MARFRRRQPPIFAPRRRLRPVLTTLLWIVALVVVAILAVSTIAGTASDESPTDDRSDHSTEHPPTSQGR